MNQTRDTLNSGFELSFGELCLRMWRRKHWAILIIGSSVLLSWNYLKYAEPLYEIQANLLLQPNAQGLSTDAKPNDRIQAELIPTQSEVLASRHLLTRTVDQFQATQPGRQSPPEELVERLSRDLSVSPVVGTQILDLSLRWDDAQQGRQLAQHLVEQYQVFLAELDQDEQSEALSTLSQTEREMRADLADLQNRFRELRLASSVIGDENSGLSLPWIQLQELAANYAAARSRRSQLENRLALLAETPNESIVSHRIPVAEPGERSATAGFKTATRLAVSTAADRDFLPPSGDQPSESSGLPAGISQRNWNMLQTLNDLNLMGLQDPTTLQAELFRAEVRQRELSEKYLPGHPERRAIESQIADWKSRLESVVQQAPQRLEGELATARSEEQRIAALYEEELENAKQADQHRMEQDHVQSQIQQVHVLHDSIVSQLTKLRLNSQATTEGGAALRVTVLQQPTVSPDPVWPNKKLVLGGGAMIGLLGSFLLSLIPVVPRPTIGKTPQADGPAVDPPPELCRDALPQ